MKLYEVKARLNGIHPFETKYFTSKDEVMKQFRKMKKRDVQWINVYLVTVNINLKSADWCKLLEADAPGLSCEVTPQDLITSHVLLATYAAKSSPEE